MNNARVNNELNLTYPDGFRDMREAELIKYFGRADNRWGVYNDDEHIILSVAWTKAKFLADADSVLFGIEARLKRNLLNYQQILSYGTKIASKKARGVRFEYRVNDVKLNQICDLVVFKHKKLFYTVWFISRKSNAIVSRRMLEETFNSLTLD